jgi:nucleotide-binding universal stress UspA family protein
MANMKILVGVDDSENALRAVRTVGKMAAKMGCHVTLLHVITPSDAALFSGKSSPPFQDKTLDDVRLHRAVETIEKFDVEYDTVIELGHPAEIILRYADREYDLVAVGSRGLSSIEGFLMGGVSSKVVHHSKVPTLVVP